MLFLLILISSLILQFFLPWWIIAPVAFGMAGWKAKSAGGAFGAAFSAIFLLWLIMGLIQTLPNENILADRVGLMLGLPGIPFRWLLVLLITGITGGCASGFAAVAGFHCRRAFVKE